MRRQSATVLSRQADRQAEYSAAVAERRALLAALLPNADPSDIKHLALNCGSIPTFPTLLRVLASR